MWTDYDNVLQGSQTLLNPSPLHINVIIEWFARRAIEFQLMKYILVLPHNLSQVVVEL